MSAYGRTTTLVSPPRRRKTLSITYVVKVEKLRSRDRHPNRSRNRNQNYRTTA
jgi:hypothetical protein